MPTIEDLRRQLTDEVSAVPTDVDRLSGVHRRITMQVRRRVVGGTVAVVAVVVGAAALLPTDGDRGAEPQPPAASSTAPQPSPTGSAADGLTADVPLPEYHLGGRLIAEGAHDASKSFEVPFTPDGSGLMFTVDCYVPGATERGDVMVDLALRGRSFGSVSCSSDRYFSGSGTWTPDPNEGVLAPLPGTVNTLVVSVPEYEPAGRVRVGVYQVVPLSEYRFPPRPTPLPVLDLYQNVLPSGHQHPLRLITPAEGLPLSSDLISHVPANGTSSYDLTLTRGLTIEGQTVAPGGLTLKVGNRVVDTEAGWDYGQSGFGATLTLQELGIRAGDQVTITVVAERFPGDSWALLLSDEAAAAG